MSRRLLPALTVFALALALPGLGLLAQDKKKVKVPSGVAGPVQKEVAKLYSEVDPDDSAGREKAFLKLDDALRKKGGDIAMRTPRFWSESILIGRQSKRKAGKTKKVTPHRFGVAFKDGDAEEYAVGEAVLHYHGATKYKPKVLHPLMLVFLERGADSAKYVSELIAAHETLKTGWIVAAVPISDDFPMDKDFNVGVDMFIAARDLFAIDSERTYFVGVGGAAVQAQKLASSALPDRLAALVLIDPTEAAAGDNSARFDTVVIRNADDAKATAVFEAYKTIDAERNKELVRGETFAADFAAWLAAAPNRRLPAEYTYVTEIDENNEGEVWSGSLFVSSPAKRGEPTTVKVKYARDTNAVEIEAQNLGEFVIYLNDDLLDLDKAIAVVVNGSELANKIFDRSMRDMFDTADQFGEWGHLFPAQYMGFVPNRIPEIVEPEEGEKKDGEKKDGDDAGGEK